MKQAPPIRYQNAPQTDALIGAAITCPTCGGPWSNRAKRVCRKCGGVIGSRHKYHLIPAGPGLFALEHRNCSNPTEYIDGSSRKTKTEPA
jgi:hypothetical protein